MLRFEPICWLRGLEVAVLAFGVVETVDFVARGGGFSFSRWVWVICHSAICSFASCSDSLSFVPSNDRHSDFL